MYQIDIKNAFLYIDLNETVYMEQPPGYVAQGEKQRVVCKLKKAIYGLKQSHGLINSVVLLVSLGFRDAKQIIQSLSKLRHQRKYACDLLQETGLLDTKSVDTPMDSNPDFWNDDDYAGAKDDRKSTFGYCTYVGGNLMTWRSKKQTAVARSSAEAEYRAMAHTSSEILWLKNLLKELGFMYDDPVPMHCDNQAAIHIANNHIFHERTKHIEVDCHIVREAVMSQKICTPFTPSEQRADIFTKALGEKQFDVLCNKLGMIDIFAPA
ncbi:UNVERIFIED_CONTAM: Retrovirus-related Pol polyprotein from transposon RE2 [Sesamum calycinum]|uniref:Retrovirus-related Pol polyprotein from transposon RE2 n=1 Tax=Sesamum calycinum TaxID=2727403 RepID=A0AAW2QJX4_9LAMI